MRSARDTAGLSVRGLAEAAGVAASTVHRIERGQLQPTVETLGQILAATGTRLELEAHVDPALNLVGLARSIRDEGATVDPAWPVRWAAELATRFRSAPPAEQRRLLLGEPPPTGDECWDAFIAALAEWLAVQTGSTAPAWATKPPRYLRRGWWVTPMTSMRAWEYAGSPASFQQHGVYLHRDSLTNC